MSSTKKLIDLKLQDLKSICELLNIDKRNYNKAELSSKIKEAVSGDVNKNRKSITEIRKSLGTPTDRERDLSIDNQALRTLIVTLQNEVSSLTSKIDSLERQNKELKDDLETVPRKHVTTKDIGTTSYVANVTTKNRFSVLSSKSEVKQPSQPNKRRIVVLSDSHGRGLSSRLGQQLRGSSCVTGSVHPSAPFHQVCKGLPSLSSQLTTKDTVVLLAGANDIYRNELNNARQHLVKSLNALKHTKTIVIGVPHRHDLQELSCVNVEIEKANRQFQKISRGYTNCKFLDVSGFNRNLFTNHGLHLNDSGKDSLCSKIVSCLTELTTQPSPVHVISNSLNLKGKGVNKPV